MKKIAVIGSGNAGCMTALHYYYWGKSQFEIEVYHSPDTHPIEKVGQGTTFVPMFLITNSLELHWGVGGYYSNPLDATLKSGIMYEGWGKKDDFFMHDFYLTGHAMHFVPQKLSNMLLESGKFKVKEKRINNPEKEIDADYIFDCRGRHGRDKDHYKPLTNPINSVLLYTDKNGRDPGLHFTKSVATPNGWTFVIPTIDGTAYGYLYNNKITSKKDAKKDFLERFNVPKVDSAFDFQNYMARDIFIGERTILNGNRAGFVEPLEATSLGFYIDIARHSWEHIVEGKPKDECNQLIQKKMKQIETFVLYHYQFGSKFDSPFWEYAKSLPFNPDYEFKDILNAPMSWGDQRIYGHWGRGSIQGWRDYFN